jgi:hypothetical protein
MVALASLIQTALWVLLIGAIAVRYHKVFGAILQAIQKRIEMGSELKAGPISLGPVSPQSPEQQVIKLDQEVAEALVAEEEEPQQPANPTTIRTSYLQAEDLALREIQTEFGVALSRLVQARGLEFDGFFVQDSTAYVIEVKYARRGVPRSILQQSVDRILARTGRLEWSKVRVILVVVYGDASVDLLAADQILSQWLASYGDRIIIRTYSLARLAKKYGIPLAISGEINAGN